MPNLPIKQLIQKTNALHQKEIKEISEIHGGSINKALCIKTSNNEKFFAKINTRSLLKMMEFEMNGLQELKKYANSDLLLIPDVLSIETLDEFVIVIMSWMDFGGGDEEILGKGLAELHLNSSKDNLKGFGSNIDGFIGFNKQLQGWKDNWADFFIELRLLPQMKQAKSWGFDIKKYQPLLKLILNKLKIHTPKPSLVHGDLWNGNCGISKDKRGIIIDPAVYWGDREVDIAMTYLFGGFSHKFYKGYESIWKLSKDFEERIDIYNLYHILNHANMFGGSYKQQSINTLSDLHSKLT